MVEKQIPIARDDFVAADPQAVLDTGLIQDQPVALKRPERKQQRSSAAHAREKDSVGLYLDRLGAYPLLDGRKEEYELFTLVRAGRDAAQCLKEDPELGIAERRRLNKEVQQAKEAHETILLANLRLVVDIAKRYKLRAGVELIDLIQEGNLGLNHAIGKFDEQKGFKFSTYATWWVRQKIGIFLDTKVGVIATPRNNRDFIDVLPLDMQLGQGSNDEIYDIVADPKSGDGFEDVDRQTSLLGGLSLMFCSVLSPEESEVLTMRFMEDKPRKEVAELRGEKEGSTYAIQKRAQAKLAHPASYQYVSLTGHLDDDEETWKEKASCPPELIDIFFPGRGESVKPAQKICAECSVVETCASYATRNAIKDGIWGGTTGRERRATRLAMRETQK